MNNKLDRPIKIINLLSRMNIGGPSVHAALLTKYLNNDKFHSLLISGSLSEGEGDMSYLVDTHHIKHHSIKTLQREISPLDDIQAVRELYRLFRREKPHIVHTNLAKAGMVGRFAAWLAGVPIIIHTYHGHVFSGYFSSAKTRLYIYIERLMARLSTRIIVVSPTIKNEICSKYRITSENKTSVIPLGFELEKMEPLDTSRGFFRKKFSIPDSALIIGIVGRITGIKNHHLFIDIAELLVQRHKNFHFLIVGDGELRENIENKVENLGLRDNVHFAGWITETVKMYADLDVMLQTSKNEGTPVTVIEAMFYKIPVISSNVGGLADLIEHNKTGFLLNSFLPEDYIPVILKLVESAEDRKKIGIAAHHFISRKFTINRLISEMTTLYTDLLKSKGFKC
jgi:glycosyltransferase involved in cell wall biosynthesis